MRFWDVLLFSGPVLPSDMTATYHAGLPSWDKKSSSLFYLIFLGACTQRTQAENLSLHLACMKTGLLLTRNPHLFFTNLRIENPGLWAEELGSTLAYPEIVMLSPCSLRRLSVDSNQHLSSSPPPAPVQPSF